MVFSLIRPPKSEPQATPSSRLCSLVDVSSPCLSPSNQSSLQNCWSVHTHFFQLSLPRALSHDHRSNPVHHAKK